MTQFVIRNMATGELGAPLGGGQFAWLDGALCLTAAYHGAEYKILDGETVTRHELVYAIVDLAEGEGEIPSYGPPSYDEANDRVIRTVTMTPAPRVIDWKANERERLRTEAKSLEESGDALGAIKLRLQALEN